MFQGSREFGWVTRKPQGHPEATTGCGWINSGRLMRTGHQIVVREPQETAVSRQQLRIAGLSGRESAARPCSISSVRCTRCDSQRDTVLSSQFLAQNGFFHNATSVHNWACWFISSWGQAVQDATRIWELRNTATENND